MKLLSLSLCVFLFTSTALFAQSKKELRAEVQRLNTELEELKKPKEVNLNNQHTEAGYALGVVMASNVQAQEMDSLDQEAIMLAIEDVFAGREQKIERAEAEKILQQYMQQLMDAKQTKAIEEAASFLTENKKKEGVKVTESGLQYKVLNEGSGQISPKPTDKVTVHYKGMLTDGTVFDSSIERGKPLTLGVNQVIPGWTEALQLMQKGDKWVLYIPYTLAYGERGAGKDIPPFSNLIFEVELLEINGQ